MPWRFQQGERTISPDELTGVQALERMHPDLPMQPNQVLRRKFEYLRHGTLSWFINFDVVTGQVIEPSWDWHAGIYSYLDVLEAGDRYAYHDRD